MFKRLAIAGCLGVCLIGAGSVVAATSAPTGPMAQSSADLALGISGAVPTTCELNTSSDQLAPRLDGLRGRAVLEFDVDCNISLEIAVGSQNGAMVHEARARMNDYHGFAEVLPYALEFEIDVAGASRPVFRSADIQSAALPGRFDVIPYTTQGRMIIDWQTAEPLVAGRYHDVITISVTGDSR